MPAGIYKITNLVNGKYYIGSSNDVEQRFSSHKSCLRAGNHANSHLQASWNKHGEEAFHFSMIAGCAPVPDTLMALEQQYINHSLNGDRSLCYNQRVLAESNLGCKFSISARANMAAAKRGKKQAPGTIAKRVAKAIGHKWNLGWKPTPENLANMRAGQQKRRRAVVQCSLSGEDLQEFASAKEAALHHGLLANPIPRACAKGFSSAGFLWRYKDQPFASIPVLARKGKHYPVQQRSLDGQLLATWPNVKEAAIGTGIGQSGISHCCYGRKKQSNGYVWSFEMPTEAEMKAPGAYDQVLRN